MLVADLRWKEAGREGIGAGLECACPGRATPTNWRCGRAARQHSAPQPGKQTLPTGRHFFRACRGEPEPGAEAAAKAEAGLRPEPMAGASDERPLFTRAAVQQHMPVELGETPNKSVQGTGGLSDGGSAEGACAAAAVLREHARDPASGHASAHARLNHRMLSRPDSERSFKNFSFGRAKCTLGRGGGY